MVPAQKKVIVRSSGGMLRWGYLPPTGFVAGGHVDLMGTDGRIMPLVFSEIETIAYVKDFNLENSAEPEQIGRRTFAARPRGEGLWLRLSFREIAPLEGLVGFDLGFVDALIEDRGLFLTPPDPRSNTLRLFAPRPAIRSLEVLGYVSQPTKKLAEKSAKQLQAALQAGLFGDS